MGFYKFSFYRKYHKYIRRKLFELSIHAANTNFHCEQEFKNLRIQFQEVLNLLKHHAKIEDNMLHSILINEFPEKYNNLIEEHASFDNALDNLDKSFYNLNLKNFDCLHDFYLTLNKFIGEYLLHLNVEEQELMPFFLSHFSEEQLMRNKRNLRVKRKLEDFLLDITNGITDCNFQEQVEFVLEIQKHESKEIIDAVNKRLKSVLSPQKYQKIVSELNKING